MIRKLENRKWKVLESRKLLNKGTLLGLALVAVLFAILLAVSNIVITGNARGKAFDEIDSLKHSKVGLLLGTTPQTRIGNKTNMFFKYRIDATVELFRAGKIDTVLVSGDANSLDGVNEVVAMQDSLVAYGVPKDRIILDGMGYRTLDSVIRAVNTYGIKDFVIISQKFHNERALYIADHMIDDKINVYAYNAKDSTSATAFLITIREYFARVKVFLDILTNNHHLYKEFSAHSYKGHVISFITQKRQ